MSLPVGGTGEGFTYNIPLILKLKTLYINTHLICFLLSGFFPTHFSCSAVGVILLLYFILLHAGLHCIQHKTGATMGQGKTFPYLTRWVYRELRHQFWWHNSKQPWKRMFLEQVEPGPGSYARSQADSWALWNSSRLLHSIRICVISWDGADPSRPNGTNVTLPVVRGKVSPCPRLRQSAANMHWMQRRHTSLPVIAQVKIAL